MVTATRYKKASYHKAKYTGGTGKTVAEIVTEQIISGLEAGNIPWHKPWLTVRPHNFVTKHQYSGINPLLCAAYCADKGYEHPLFASFKQIDSIGGKVNKGEHGHIVVWSQLATYDKDGHKVEAGEADREDIHKVFSLRFYKVFNIAQTDLNVADYVKLFETPRKLKAEKLLQAKKPKISVGDKACYNPKLDRITLPDIARFEKQTDFYLTAFHELTHWTGHPSRCDRFQLDNLAMFGSETYSQEELVAEIGANMLGMDCGITPGVPVNSVAYIQSWLKALRNDPKMVIRAASQAQKATDYLTK